MRASDKDTCCDGLHGWLNITAHDMLKTFLALYVAMAMFRHMKRHLH